MRRIEYAATDPRGVGRYWRSGHWLEAWTTIDPLDGRAAMDKYPGRALLLTRPWERIQFASGQFALGLGVRVGGYPRRYSTARATTPQGKLALARRVAP
ncbi:MAG: hypothetical protein KGS61_21085, partial [Verrucomicrobia bacterium]|nr:hypothetical protein [Verrucomicrobiota bacterium]